MFLFSPFKKPEWVPFVGFTEDGEEVFVDLLKIPLRGRCIRRRGG